jgi:hypothetical protein
MAWRQRRRARPAADPLLWLDCERAPARATLAYYNLVGDPSLWAELVGMVSPTSPAARSTAMTAT